jgi:hypothetical protein
MYKKFPNRCNHGPGIFYALPFTKSDNMGSDEAFCRFSMALANQKTARANAQAVGIMRLD